MDIKGNSATTRDLVKENEVEKALMARSQRRRYIGRQVGNIMEYVYMGLVLSVILIICYSVSFSMVRSYALVLVVMCIFYALRSVRYMIYLWRVALTSSKKKHIIVSVIKSTFKMISYIILICYCFRNVRNKLQYVVPAIIMLYIGILNPIILSSKSTNFCFSIQRSIKICANVLIAIQITLLLFISNGPNKYNMLFSPVWVVAIISSILFSIIFAMFAYSVVTTIRKRIIQIECNSIIQYLEKYGFCSSHSPLPSSPLCL
jgi:hypothetical protein